LLAGAGIDVSEPDTDELADPDPGIRQGLDQHDVAGAAGRFATGSGTR